ncbi:MAG: PhoH family protein [Actinomycetota bacterium]|nr:PhoH family protein [Actinomycetota bacterium]
MVSVLGTRDELLKLVEGAFDVDILVRGNEITVTGSDAETRKVVHLFEEFVKLLEGGQGLDEGSVRATIGMVQEAEHPNPSEVLSDEALSHRGRAIRAKTVGQKRYLDAIRANTVVFAIGPAGTGKTYLAMAMAVLALRRKEVNRIILTRPAVEAGERLGFLPGTLYEKIDPYLRPLFDALYDMMDAEQIELHLQRGTIEVAPLAYMRGRTLNDSFIVLDEAQNTTAEQMKMFLTRLGFGSKAVVTGDVTQVDLPSGRHSGLQVVRDILPGIDGVAFCELTGRDVVRHRIVQQIVEAYRVFDEARQGQAGRSGVAPSERAAQPGPRPVGPAESRPQPRASAPRPGAGTGVS